MYKDQLDQQTAMIDSLSMPDDFKFKAKKEATRQFTDNYWAARSQIDPQGTKNELSAAVPANLQPQLNGPAGLITKEAKAQGVDPNVALAISHLETGGTFDPGIKPPPTASNPHPTAQGLFQMIGSTWSQFPGATDENRLDPVAQAKFGVMNLAQNQKALQQTLGRKPTPGELMLSQLGIGTASAILKSPDSMPVVEALTKNAKMDAGQAGTIVDNNAMTGLTVGQARQKWDGLIAQHMAKTQGMADAPATQQEADIKPSNNPALANLTLPDRMKWLTHAESLIRKDDTQQKVALTAQINDGIAAASEGNSAPFPDASTVISTFGPQHGAILNEQMRGWQDYAYKYNALQTQSAPQIMQTLAADQPAPGPGYADAMVRHDRLVAAAQKIDNARKDNYVDFAMRPGVGLTHSIDWTQPEAFSGPLRARALQAGQLSKDWQVPYAPFSKQDVNDLGQMLDKAPTQQAISMLQQMHGAFDTEDHYQAAVAQLAPNHPTLAVAGTLPEIGYAGVQNPAQYVIAGERMLRPDNGDKAETGPAKVLMPGNQTGGFRDLWDKSVAGAFPGEKSSDQYYNAAVAYYIGKQDPAKRSDKVSNIDTNLWNEAVNVVAPSVQWGNGKVLVPQGVYPTAFRDTMAKVWPGVMQAYGLDPAEHNMDGYPLKMLADGKYAVQAGSTALWGANGHPVVFGLDGSVPVMTVPPEFQPNAPKLGKVKDPLEMPMKRGSR
jgi:hypothetical protein